VEQALLTTDRVLRWHHRRRTHWLAFWPDARQSGSGAGNFVSTTVLFCVGKRMPHDVNFINSFFTKPLFHMG
jgi:hypothetical protein